MKNKAQSEILGLLLIVAIFFMFFALVYGLGGGLISQQFEGLLDQKSLSEYQLLANGIDSVAKTNGATNTIILERGSADFTIKSGQNITIEAGSEIVSVDNVGSVESPLQNMDGIQYNSGNIFVLDNDSVAIKVKKARIHQSENTLYFPITKIKSNSSRISGNIFAKNTELNSTFEKIGSNTNVTVTVEGEDSFVWSSLLVEQFGENRTSVNNKSGSKISIEIENTENKTINYLNIRESVISLEQR